MTSILAKYNATFLNKLNKTVTEKQTTIKNTLASTCYAPLEKSEIIQSRENRKKLYAKHHINPNKKPAIGLKHDITSIDFNSIKARMEKSLQTTVKKQHKTTTKRFKTTHNARKVIINDTCIAQKLDDISTQLLNVTTQLNELRRHYNKNKNNENMVNNEVSRTLNVDVDWYYYYYNNDNWYYYYNKLVEFIRLNKRFPTFNPEVLQYEKNIYKWFAMQQMLKDKLSPYKISLLHKVETCIKIDL